MSPEERHGRLRNAPMRDEGQPDAGVMCCTALQKSAGVIERISCLPR